MIIATTIEEARAVRATWQGTVGFVPTMGCLHEGHRALALRATSENDHTMASIFVNPTQFAPHEDLARYPRTFPEDRALLTSAQVDAVFTPTVLEMYPPDFQTEVQVGAVSQPLEGARRPTHFRGVATVVWKFLQIVQPTRLYLGQKDAQQVAVIRQMMRDLNSPVEIVVVGTVRAADGLALSSRNTYLSPEERAAAPILYRALRAAQSRIESGERNAETIREAMRIEIKKEPLARVDYVSVADGDTLREQEQITGLVILSMAVYFRSVRLIDNISMVVSESEI